MDNLFHSRLTRPLTLTNFIIDNIYENPYKIREYALIQTYEPHTYHPGIRTNFMYTQPELSAFLNKVFLSYNLKIIDIQNCFQYNTADEYTWIHHDKTSPDSDNIYAGIIYLTPNAPILGGTAMYKYIDGTMDMLDSNLLQNKKNISENAKDSSKWLKITQVGNIFNRLVIYNSANYHSSMEYFGNNIQDARLMQLLFIHVKQL